MSEKERFRRVIVRVICEAMELQNVGRSELARRMGVNRARASQLLRGDSNFEMNTLARIADALDLECEFNLRPKHQAVIRSIKPRQPLVICRLPEKCGHPRKYYFCESCGIRWFDGWLCPLCRNLGVVSER